MPDREFYMALALALAEEAAAAGEVPVGCVVVGPDGTVIGRGRNLREETGDASAHAEMLAIREACRTLGDWRLEGCALYVTLEPCPMCAGAIVQARIPRVVIGCMNPKAGCAGSVLNLLSQEGFNHRCQVEKGVLGEGCSQMMKDFFRELREKGKGEREGSQKSAASSGHRI